jgi:hypothetical protein
MLAHNAVRSRMPPSILLLAPCRGEAIWLCAYAPLQGYVLDMLVMAVGTRQEERLLVGLTHAHLSCFLCAGRSVDPLWDLELEINPGTALYLCDPVLLYSPVQPCNAVGLCMALYGTIHWCDSVQQVSLQRQRNHAVVSQRVLPPQYTFVEPLCLPTLGPTCISRALPTC